MGNAHQMIVDDVGEIIGGHAVLLDEHHVVQGIVGEGHVAENQIVIGGFPLRRRVLADDVGDARVQLRLHLLLGQMEAVLVINAYLLAVDHLGETLEPFLIAEAVICLSFFNKLLSVLKIDAFCLSFRLNIRAKSLVLIRTFIMDKACCCKCSINNINSTFHKALLVSVFYSKKKISSLVLSY